MICYELLSSFVVFLGTVGTDILYQVESDASDCLKAFRAPEGCRAFFCLDLQTKTSATLDDVEKAAKVLKEYVTYYFSRSFSQFPTLLHWDLRPDVNSQDGASVVRIIFYFSPLLELPHLLAMHHLPRMTMEFFIPEFAAQLKFGLSLSDLFDSRRTTLGEDLHAQLQVKATTRARVISLFVQELLNVDEELAATADAHQAELDDTRRLKEYLKEQGWEGPFDRVTLERRKKVLGHEAVNVILQQQEKAERLRQNRKELNGIVTGGETHKTPPSTSLVETFFNFVQGKLGMFSGSANVEANAYSEASDVREIHEREICWRNTTAQVLRFARFLAGTKALTVEWNFENVLDIVAKSRWVAERILSPVSSTLSNTRFSHRRILCMRLNILHFARARSRKYTLFYLTKDS
jgi:hypothetical protein